MDAGSLNIVFPKTLEILHEKRISYLQEQFHKTLREQLQVRGDTDVSRWFPVFLKFQGIRPEVLEVAEFEYLQHLVSDSEEEQLRLDQGQLAVNPSAQFVELHHFQPKLNRTAGLYCFFKQQNKMTEYKLSLPQALVIDLLHEERKYSLDQLALQSTIHKMGTSKNLQEWKTTILEMLKLGLLVGPYDQNRNHLVNSDSVSAMRNNN